MPLRKSTSLPIVVTPQPVSKLKKPPPESPGIETLRLPEQQPQSQKGLKQKQASHSGPHPVVVLSKPSPVPKNQSVSNLSAIQEGVASGTRDRKKPSPHFILPPSSSSLIGLESPHDQRSISLSRFSYAKTPRLPIAGPLSQSADTLSSTISRGWAYSRYPTTQGVVSVQQGSLSGRQTDKNGRFNSIIDLNRRNSEGGPEKTSFSSFIDDASTSLTLNSDHNFPLYLSEDDLDEELQAIVSSEDYPRKGFWGGFNKKGLRTMFCLVSLITGALGLFIVLPVVVFTGHTTGKPWGKEIPETPKLIDYNYPILKASRKDLIDSDTPEWAYTRKSVYGGDLRLVFSDEFNVDGRTFYENDDQFWEAADLHYAATQDLEWYDPDAITTKDGTLQIQFDAFHNHDLNYRSGMLTTWNKICFTGGVLEVSASLPGPLVPGLWPGIWTMGNLGRPGYKATTEGTWPYSYSQCDAGITPNQSNPDGLSYLPGQKLNSCVCDEDIDIHPSLGVGRGAPEIDAVEATIEAGLGLVSQSCQIAPFDAWYLPDYDYVSIKNTQFTMINKYTGGPFQQAISGLTALNSNWYDGQQFQKYAFEYVPGGEDGYIAWFVGDEETLRMTSNAIGPNGKIGQREISKEPMSIILNLGMSQSWSQIDINNLRFPAIMYIDYVRWYQKSGDTSVTCDPKGYPTTEYIEKHWKAYTNPNATIFGDADKAETCKCRLGPRPDINGHAIGSWGIVDVKRTTRETDKVNH